MNQLQQRLDYANKRVKFAWAKYYERVNDGLRDAHRNRSAFTRVADDVAIPPHIKAEMKDMATALKKQWECPVCIEMIADGDLEITNCGHYYCKPCVSAWQQTCKDRGEPKWKCGVCNRQHKYE